MQIFSTAPEAPDAPDLAEEPDEHIQHLEQAEIASFTQKAQDGWKLQFTDDEAFALRSIQNAVHILDPNKAFSLSDKLNVEGLSTVSLSPGKNPYIAVFVAERKVCTFLLTLGKENDESLLGHARKCSYTCFIYPRSSFYTKNILQC